MYASANSDIRQSSTETNLDLRLNFLSTYNGLEAMRINKVKQIVFASTSAIFGDTAKVNRLGWKALSNSEQAVRITVKKLKEELGF